MRRASEEKIVADTLPLGEQRADVIVPEALSEDTRHRLGVIQRLESRQNRDDYNLEQQEKRPLVSHTYQPHFSARLSEIPCRSRAYLLSKEQRSYPDR